MKTLDPKTGISIENVLFPTDFSPAAEAALSYASAVADRYQSRLYVAHVINLESFDLLESESARITLQKAHDEAQRKITELLDPLHLPRDRYRIVVADGAISDVLVEIIRRNRAGLAAVGWYGLRRF